MSALGFLWGRLILFRSILMNTAFFLFLWLLFIVRTWVEKDKKYSLNSLQHIQLYPPPQIYHTWLKFSHSSGQQPCFNSKILPIVSSDHIYQWLQWVNFENAKRSQGKSCLVMVQEGRKRFQLLIIKWTNARQLVVFSIFIPLSFLLTEPQFCLGQQCMKAKVLYLLQRSLLQLEGI